MEVFDTALVIEQFMFIELYLRYKSSFKYRRSKYVVENQQQDISQKLQKTSFITYITDTAIIVSKGRIVLTFCDVSTA